MKEITSFLLVIFFTISGYSQGVRLEKGRLVVDGKPILLRSGELGNSSASSMEYMREIWPRVKKMNLNTLIVPVYWELLEPREGIFDFRLLDSLIMDARRHSLRLVLLWFGTWKNSMSCYVPEWIKTDQSRFPRAAAASGRPEEIITPFSENALTADKQVFTAMMRHIRRIDGKVHTVVMIQVENEIGMLPDARDHSSLANTAFSAPVPAALLTYLHKDRGGSWEEVFGRSPAADEIFMAWYFARYVEEIAAAGKKIYDIPMYVNAALNAPGKNPGQYPSAGPLPHLMDIWKLGAPSIDFLSPDFYNPDFKHWNDLYARPDNVLFIPEHRFEAGVAAKAFYAFGHYHAIGFSPFSIESGTEPIDKCYDIIAQLETLITGPGKVEGVLLSKDADTMRFELGDYIVTATHDLRLGWSPKAKEDQWPLSGGIIIALSDDEFYVGGTGIVLSFETKGAHMRAGILRAEEGRMVNGRWAAGRRMNGDQDHQGRHIRIPEAEYGIQRVKLYSYR